MSIQKILFVFIGLVTIFFSYDSFATGVGILDSSEQTGISITCPAGVINCSAYSSRAAEADQFSIASTQAFLLELLAGVLNFAALAAVVMLVIAGIRYAISMGGDEALKTARNHVIWTIAGLLIIMLALLIVRNITETLYSTIGPKTAPTTPVIPQAVQQAGQDQAAPVANSAACHPPDTIPAACYTGDTAGLQTSVASCQVAGEVLRPICKMLGLSEDLGGSCTVIAIQNKLIAAGAYAGLPSNCSKADGKYGQCTRQAVEAYCSKATPN